MAFEIYKPTRGGSTRKKRYISITKSHTFGLPRPFLTEHGIKEGLKVVVMYDSDTKRIALCFTDKPIDYGYALRVSKNEKHGGWVVAKGFFEDKKIRPAEYTGHYDYEQVPLYKLGVPGSNSVGYVITLKERNAASTIKDVTGGERHDLADPEF